MARRRFFVDQIHDGRAELTGDDARHLSRVLRVEPGQRYELSDNHCAYLAEIDAVASARVTFRILEALPAPRPAPQIALYPALIKFDRFEWVVEKATELGVARVVPVITERAEKGLAGAAPKRLERWRKIARESSQQSRRLQIPEIQPAEPFTTAVSAPASFRFFLDENPATSSLLSVLPPDPAPDDLFSILTGPEGGWTDRERTLALAAGWKPVSLGPNILRAETAAIAGLAVLSQVRVASH